MSAKADPWYQLAAEMLSKADVIIDGTRPWDLKVKNPEMFRRVLQEGSLGLGESYMDGWWDCEQLDEFFYRILKHRVKEYLPSRWSDFFRVAAARMFNMQSKSRSLKVCDVHYNLSNDLYSRMLDPSMQYTCAYWKGATSLEEAQQNKMRLICEKLQLSRGMRLLDLGCGFGSLAEYAARHYGVRVTAVTNSSEQARYATQRCEGLDVQVLLKDYRDMEGDQFDRIAAVGLLEHVGPKNHQSFFEVVDRFLRPDGVFLLHCIGSNTSVVKPDDWMDRYIFPNACLPSVQQIGAASEPYFVMEDWHNIGPDYDTTLMAWHTRFLAAWPELSNTHDERFKRMFVYYLDSCAGAFRARHLQLWQVVFTRGIDGGVHIPRA